MHYKYAYCQKREKKRDRQTGSETDRQKQTDRLRNKDKQAER